MNYQALAQQGYGGEEEEDRPTHGLSVEDVVENRLRRKTLADCTLPEGFRLVTATPRQMVIGGLLIWSFVLEFGTRHPLTGQPETWLHQQRYEMRVSDEIQMKWAMDEFTRDLIDAGYDPAKFLVPIPMKGSKPSGRKRTRDWVH